MLMRHKEITCVMRHKKNHFFREPGHDFNDTDNHSDEGNDNNDVAVSVNKLRKSVERLGVVLEMSCECRRVPRVPWECIGVSMVCIRDA